MVRGEGTEEGPGPFQAPRYPPSTLAELKAAVARGEDQLLGLFEARWTDPDHPNPVPGILVVTAHGVCFARRRTLGVLAKGPDDYPILPMTEVDFVRDFYLTSSLLDLRQESDGTRAIFVGASRYHVDDPSEVFQAIYRAKESAMARIAPILPRGGPRRPSTPVPPTLVREVIHEVVKVPCKYCGSLVEVTASACPRCGAPFHI